MQLRNSTDLQSRSSSRKHVDIIVQYDIVFAKGYIYIRVHVSGVPDTWNPVGGGGKEV
jgi:hypothetical protein